jgi:CheY-like chemotaxis protein
LGVQAGTTGYPAPQTESIGAPPGTSAKGMRILFVEDNPVNLEVGRTMLTALGCNVTTRENGQEALETLESSTFDVVLMDCQMPTMDGYQATRELRRREMQAGATRTTVIAVTANAMDTDRQASLEAGMDDHLSKPFLQQELMEKLMKWRRPEPENPSIHQ